MDSKIRNAINVISEMNSRRKRDMWLTIREIAYIIIASVIITLCIVGLGLLMYNNFFTKFN